MAKKKPKLTPNQLEYQRQLKLLNRRIKSWERKGYDFDVYIPKPSKRVTTRDIQKLKDIQFKRFTKEERQIAWARYEERESEERYDIGHIDVQQIETTDEPVSTIAEMDEWIDELINSILNPTIIEEEREDSKETLLNLLETAKRELGVKNFYSYLQQKDVVDKLNTYASDYINSYVKHDGTDTGAIPLQKFAETLNLGRPLTLEQNESLTMYGTINLDYTDTDYD